MAFTGQLRDGVVVFPNPVSIPEGTSVQVTELPTGESGLPGDFDPDSSPFAELLPLAGSIDDLPEDLALNHDHYLYGAPKR